jgi:hypothetical protein
VLGSQSAGIATTELLALSAREAGLNVVTSRTVETKIESDALFLLYI